MVRTTYFYDTEGNRLGNDDILLPIQLYKGMHFTMHSYEGTVFEVVDWAYHHGQPDEEAGLKIFLKAIE